ncbi:septum formation initiator family protein [Geodermatophilus sp. URMC 64]
MSSVRGRRGAAPAGRRAAGRGVSRATGPVHTGPVRSARSTAPSRPGQRRSGRRPARSGAGARRRPLFTGRAVLLGALVLLLALTLAGPVRQFLAGRAQLVELAAERSRLEQRAQELQDQLERQADPAFTVRQARERLTYVLPGDRLVVVVDGRTVEGDAGTLPSGETRSAERPPWYEGLMESLATADGDAAGSGG